MARGLCIANADVRTSDPGLPRAQALLLDGNRIRAVGEERTLLRRAHAGGVRVLDLGGRLVLPGLIDSHTHLVHQGLLSDRIDLHGTRSLEEALQRVRRQVPRASSDRPLIAERWDESRWKERRFPRRDELDALSTRVPIILRRIDGHIAVANERAARMVAERLSGVDLDRGHLVEEASLNLNQVFPTPVPDAVRALEEAQEKALALGITTVHDFVVPSYFRAFQALSVRGRLRLRAHVSIYVEYLDSLERAGVAAGLGGDRLRMHGIKVFADGSFGGRTAALREPYLDDAENRGRLNHGPEALRSIARRAQEAGLPVSAHAIGDAAIDAVVEAYGGLGRKGALRHRIEHFELPSPESVDAVAGQGLVASMQPNFVGTWSAPGGMYEARLGARRIRRTNEFRSLKKRGVRLAFGSDCLPLDPWFGIQSCLKAPRPTQRLSFDEAVEAYTAGSAWGLGRERDLGRLKAGYRADLVAVEADPHRPDRLGAARVLFTLVDGQPAFARGPWRARLRRTTL